MEDQIWPEAVCKIYQIILSVYCIKSIQMTTFHSSHTINSATHHGIQSEGKCQKYTFKERTFLYNEGKMACPRFVNNYFELYSVWLNTCPPFFTITNPPPHAYTHKPSFYIPEQCMQGWTNLCEFFRRNSFSVLCSQTVDQMTVLIQCPLEYHCHGNNKCIMGYSDILILCVDPTEL